MSVTITIDLPEEAAESLRTAAASRGEDLNRYATVVLTAIARSAKAGYAEGQSLLSSPGHASSESFARLRSRHGLPDLSQLSQAEIEARVKATTERMEPALRDALFEAEP